MEKNIIEGNKLIAKFMGWDEETLLLPYINGGKGTCRSTEFKYHSSFDWLMPVVEKIESMGYETEIYNNCGNGMLFTHMNWTNDIERTGSSKLEAVYLTVVDFIKWYNKDQKSKRSVASKAE